MSNKTIDHHQTNSGMSLLRFVNCAEERIDPTRRWVQGQDAEWRKIFPGLNLKGTCPSKNEECSGQTVWVPLGYSKSEDASFNMNKECAKVRCVACKTLLKEVENAHFIHCRVTLNGMDENCEEIHEEKEAPIGNQALTFEENGGQNITFWKFLEIKVTKLQKTNEPQDSNPFMKWFWSLFKKNE